MSNPETKTAKAAAPATFTREQLAASNRYARRRDLVTACWSRTSGTPWPKWTA